MANSVSIPQDIIYYVTAAIASDIDDSCATRTLRQCALVSSSFLLPCRKQLFSKIELISHQPKTAQTLHQIFIQNPVLQSFVRSICIFDFRRATRHDDIECWLNSSASLLAILQLSFCRLESFSLCLWRSWYNLSSEVKDALSNILHSSTLKTLVLDGVANMPITVLLGIVHLTKLELRNVWPHDFNCNRSSSLTPKAVAPTASHTPVIDHCVWYLPDEDRCTRFPTSCYFSLISH
jgi:hypothetical protein